jgi:predicted ATPase
MVAEMLAQPEAPDALREPFVEASEGSPFFVVEYVRTAIAEGWLRRAPAGGWRLADEGVAPLPRSHRDLVDRRLATLSPPARALLGVAAALGRDLDSALLCAVAEAPEEEVLTAVQELVVRCLLEDGGDDRLRFAHDRLREGAYAALSGERRRELHRRAAAAVERRLTGAAGDALLYPVLAHHWVHAGARRQAF